MKANINRIILIILLLLVVPSVTAQYCDGSLGTFKQNDCILIKTISNSSSITLSTLSYPNSTIAIQNKPMVQNGLSFSYLVCNTSEIGTYTYDYYDNENKTCVNSFDVTSTGMKRDVSYSLLYIGLIGFLLVFLVGVSFLFVTFDNLLNRISMLGISYMLFIAIVFTSWNMAKDYLTDASFLTETFRIFFWILMISALPLLLGFFAFYTIQLFKIKEIESLMEKGMDFDEAERRTHRSRY